MKNKIKEKNVNTPGNVCKETRTFRHFERYLSARECVVLLQDVLYILVLLGGRVGNILTKRN